MNLPLFRVALFVLGLLPVLSVPLSALQAQDNTITLSVAVPDMLRPMITDQTFQNFESSHPGIKVHVTYPSFDTWSPPSPAAGLDDHFAKVEELVSAADVMLVNPSSMSVEATRAGYYLDLTPLTSTDTSLNVDDFVPAAWQSFQWDGGVWALPVSMDVIIMIYDPAAFDTAGIPYPTDNWTIEDSANAAKALTQYDTDGKVTMPGLVTFNNTGYLLRSLLGKGLYDRSVFPEAPSFSNPDLAALLTRWAQLESDGVVASSINGDISSAPLRIFSSFGLEALPGSNSQPPGAVLLPGGSAGLDVQGVAVSSGTQYPEQAYALASFITNSIQFADSPFGGVSARRSLADQQPTPQEKGGDGAFFIRRALSPEAQAAVDKALAHGIPVSEMRFADYAAQALDKINTDNLDAATALQDAEAAAVANLQAAAEKRTTLSIVVTPSPAEAALQPGEISLKFGIQSFINPMPNVDQWNQLAQEFADADPQVGKVELDTTPGTVDQFSDRDDCFYLPYNAVPGLNPGKVLNLDPFIDADPELDKTDFVGNTLTQVQRDNKTWALPLVVMPQILRYNSDLLAKAGVTVPVNGWTIDQFVDALKTLKTAYADQKPFEPRDPGGSYLLLLIAAYGGVPLDFRTNPPTVNFTDPATVDAIRQVLDLAKNGYIDYRELARTQFMISMSGDAPPDLIRTEALNGVRFIVGGPKQDTYHTALYPTGSQFSAISYDIGTAYISASSQNPDACYRWLSTIASHPELLSAMPARRSLINDPSFTSSQGADVIAAYQQFDALMQNPKTVYFPTAFAGEGGSPGNYILQFLLNRAFDHYVLKDADLATELQDAQTVATAFLGCAADIPAFDPNAQTQGDYFKQYTDCAVKVDPTLSLLFPTK